MIILTNCLTQTPDEGCRKVVNSLLHQMKEVCGDMTVISYESNSPLSDRHMKLNKLLLNGELITLLRQSKEPLLYIPSPAKMFSFALRLYILSRFAKCGLRALSVMEFPVGWLSRLLIRASGAQVISISRHSWQTYRRAIGDQAAYLKAGVDTQLFSPVPTAQKVALREKYNIPQDKTVVIHAGHLNRGRNVERLAHLDPDMHGILVLSTQTRNQRDMKLRKVLEARENITIFDEYLPNIEELYQLSDLYLFPVVEQARCIDAPISALEAASCGLPVLATPYGELRELLGKDGFYTIRSMEPRELNDQIREIAEKGKSPRANIMEYDWDRAVDRLISMND